MKDSQLFHAIRGNGLYAEVTIFLNNNRFAVPFQILGKRYFIKTQIGYDVRGMRTEKRPPS